MSHQGDALFVRFVLADNRKSRAQPTCHVTIYDDPAPTWIPKTSS